MRIQLLCPVCNRFYPADSTRVKHGRQTTCSRECSYILRGRNLAKNTVTIPCSVCGQPMTRSPAQIRSKNVFCSPECHYKGRGLGLVARTITGPYVITPQGLEGLRSRQRDLCDSRKRNGSYYCKESTKEKLRVSTAKAIADGRIPRVSGLEKDVGLVLDSLGFTYIPQYHIRGDSGRFVAVVDFFFRERNVALEVNGTFWHSDPREFPDGPKHPSQIRTAKKYARKMTLMKNLGIPVIELWEMDFRKDPVGSVKMLLGA